MNGVFIFGMTAALLVAGRFLQIWRPLYWLLERRDARSRARGKILRAAVKAEILPFLAELGFRKRKEPLAARPIDKPWWPNVFARRRGIYSDEIHIQWDKWWGPQFQLKFWTDQIERMIAPPTDSFQLDGVFYASLCRGCRRGFLEPWCGEYGGKMSVEMTIALAKRRITDLDSYLRTGEPSENLLRVKHLAVGPAPWGKYQRPMPAFEE